MRFLILFILFIFLISFSSAVHLNPSNESLEALRLLNQAKADILEMTARNINISRVNETYNEAFQLYSAQIVFEERGGKADYHLAVEYALDISSIKKIAFQADDELKIFNEAFKSAEKETNLSGMQEEYDALLSSFYEERFEETLDLIDGAYESISEIQSSQTVLNVFYTSTSKTIKNFLINNWKKIIIITGVILFLILIFWKSLQKLFLKMNFDHLTAQKKAINGLLKNMQADYFKTKKISEREYNIKLQKYKELTREIERQLMVLREKSFKVNM